MNALTLLGIFLLVFLGTALFLKVPVAYAIGAAALVTVAAGGYNLISVAQVTYSSLDSFPFLAVPLFIYGGAIMQYSGISESLLNLVDAYASRIRGNRGIVTIIGSAAFGVLTGSCMATISAIGKIMAPDMERRGYRKSYTAALIAACSFLGILIPPSVPGIMYALSAGVSVSKVWLCTIGPAFLFIIAYTIINFYVHGRKETKDSTPFVFSDYSKNIAKSTLSAFAAILMPLIIFGGIYGGIFTATEAGAVSCLYGLFFFAYKLIFRRKEISESLIKITVASAVSTATIAMLMAFSAAAGRVMSIAGVANALADFITNNIQSTFVLLLGVNIIFLILGMLIDINAAIMIMVPLLLPSVQRFGIDPIHFAGITLVNLCVGYLTPPFAASIFVAQKITGASFTAIVKDSIPFLFVGLIIIVLVTAFPEISTFLPNLLG